MEIFSCLFKKASPQTMNTHQVSSRGLAHVLLLAFKYTSLCLRNFFRTYIKLSVEIVIKIQPTSVGPSLSPSANWPFPWPSERANINKATGSVELNNISILIGMHVTTHKVFPQKAATCRTLHGSPRIIGAELHCSWYQWRHMNRSFSAYISIQHQAKMRRNLFHVALVQYEMSPSKCFHQLLIGRRWNAYTIMTCGLKMFWSTQPQSSIWDQQPCFVIDWRPPGVAEDGGPPTLLCPMNDGPFGYDLFLSFPKRTLYYCRVCYW